MCSTHFNKDDSLWYGNDFPPLYNPEISLAQALLNAMTIFGSKTAQINDNNGVEMSFDDMKLKTIRAAQNLKSFRYKRGQVFTIVATNSHNVAPITFASIAIGCSINPLATSFGKTELIQMFKITKPALIFCDIDCYEQIVECLADLGNRAKIFTFGGSVGRSEPVESLFNETYQEDQFIPVKVDAIKDIAMIVCTSGTTGFPKGVCVSHATLVDAHSKQSDISNSSDVMLSFSPLYCSCGIGVLIRATLIGATRIITTENFTPELQLQLIEKYRVTYCMNGPHQWILMMRCDRYRQTDLSSLKCALVSVSKVPIHLKTQLNPILTNAYGMSEICGQIAYDYPSKGKDCVGQLVDGICIKIVDEDGNRCGVNKNGGVCLKTSYKFLGYFENPTATQETLDKEDFIVTGDIGYFDEDGDLYLVGRKKELIKYCNMQISPPEIDAFLMESPHIKSVCVVRIEDPVVGDLPAAVIIRADSSNISEKDIFDMVADHFADHYKLRGGVYFVDSLPTTASGKVSRRQVTEIANNLYNARKA